VSLTIERPVKGRKKLYPKSAWITPANARLLATRLFDAAARVQFEMEREKKEARDRRAAKLAERSKR
jgi:hypothetical protein